jgi:hypothetical protein
MQRLKEEKKMQHARGRNVVKSERCSAQDRGGMNLNDGYGGLILF